MFKAVETVLFGRKKSTSPFKFYYNEWLSNLENNLLPNLRRAMSSSSSSTILSTHVDAVHRHFQAYYEALNLAATEQDVSQLLFPEWRNSLEKPFLFLGDLHPYLFTNLLRSFLDTNDNDDDGNDQENAGKLSNFRESREYLDKPWHVLMAWENGNHDLMSRVEQIECVLKLRVPDLVSRARKAQSLFVQKIGGNLVEFGGKMEAEEEDLKVGIREGMIEEMEEFVSVFVEANRLRSSVLADILSATNVYQAALFLEGLAQFLVGFHDHKLLKAFEKCKTVID